MTQTDGNGRRGGLCRDCRTGKRVYHYEVVNYDIDYFRQEGAPPWVLLV
jgi:hypothetical protein